MNLDNFVARTQATLVDAKAPGSVLAMGDLEPPPPLDPDMTAYTSSTSVTASQPQATTETRPLTNGVSPERRISFRRDVTPLKSALRNSSPSSRDSSVMDPGPSTSHIAPSSSAATIVPTPAPVSAPTALEVPRNEDNRVGGVYFRIRDRTGEPVGRKFRFPTFTSSSVRERATHYE